MQKQTTTSIKSTQMFIESQMNKQTEILDSKGNTTETAKFIGLQDENTQYAFTKGGATIHCNVNEFEVVVDENTGELAIAEIA